ncbi:hypothetical protein GCM10027436_22250 [Actinophytocola sediminis]
MVDAIDPVAVVASGLTGAALTAEERACVVRPWPNMTSSTDLLLVSDGVEAGGLLVSEPILRALYTSALATLAATELMVPGPVQAAVFGVGLVMRLQLMLTASRLRTVSRIVVHPMMVGTGTPLDTHVIALVDLTGVELSMTDDVEDAVSGASLVIVTGDSVARIGAGGIAAGTVVVNASGRTLPELVAAAERIYVDDPALLDERTHDHLTQQAVDAGLAQVLSGAHPGRSGTDETVLVELLGAGALDIRLACQLYRATDDRGLWSGPVPWPAGDDRERNEKRR